MSISDRHDHRFDDQGSALVIVLIFIIIGGFLGIMFLDQAQTNFDFAQAANRVQDRLTAVDGGLNTAIQRVRKTPGLCSSTTQTALGADVVVNGQTIQLKCQLTTAGSTAPAADAWAVFLTGDNNGVGQIHTQQGGGQNKLISGAIYSETGNWDLKAPLKVTGDTVIHAASCPASVNNLTVTPAPFTLSCVTTALPTPAATQPLPSTVPAKAAARTSSGGCTVLSPGRYSQGDGNSNDITNLGNGPIFFKSGVYVLHNLGSVQFDSSGNANSGIVGGRSFNSSSVAAEIGGTNPCLATATSDTRNGVMLILTGNTTISLNNNAKVALYGYVAPGSNNQVGTSIRQIVAADPSIWKSNPLSVSSITGTILQDGNGNGGYLRMYGNVYTPHAGIVLSATNSSTAELKAGVVAADFTANASASAASIPLATSAGVTAVVTSAVITAINLGAGGEKDVSATTTVRISADANRTVSIDNWFVSNP